MDDTPALGQNDASGLAKALLSQYDAPAYVRRARRVDHAWASLLDVCQQRREVELVGVRLRLGRLQALAQDWGRLDGWLLDAEVLPGLCEELQPRLRLALRPTASARRLRAALDECLAALARFNGRWTTFVASLDLVPLNQAIEEYNRYYVLEKECLVHSPWIALRGFECKSPVGVATVLDRLPPLPIPRSREGTT